ncbi:unnamed protein product [Clavelina lepadiformis]|uniref:Carbohydrate kinase FGGY N-terminal domain-containing protein n=1 Tax=Clavelina lepadiformis TaxID=159417 RepID=A0ABP0FEX8_CLALP
MGYLLGIDIGTTSTKALVIDESHASEILTCHSCYADAQIDIEKHANYNEQDVNKIVASINEVLKKISLDLGTDKMAQISKIGICGQMHGCLFWKKDHISASFSTFIEPDDVSNLITWLDARCDVNFIASLPISKTSPMSLSTGFGCATILWLKKNRPEFLMKYDCSGTIADYVVSRLCHLAEPIMSTQNAASWGYFDSHAKTWDRKVMELANFPMHFLPKVITPCTTIGQLKNCLHGISDNATVMVAMGDMQCSVMSCRIVPGEAVINLSTSAQLSTVLKQSDQSRVKPDKEEIGRLPNPVIKVPYFGDYDLMASASLNGGAVFANFVEMLMNWTRQFKPDVTVDEIYQHLLNNNPDPNLQGSIMNFVPTLNGERHQPEATASLNSIKRSDLNFPTIARSLARGILENLRSMFEAGVALDGIRHLWACGGAFAKNRLFREELENQVFNHVTVSFDRNADAAYGAALAANEH